MCHCLTYFLLHWDFNRSNLLSVDFTFLISSLNSSPERPKSKVNLVLSHNKAANTLRNNSLSSSL